MRSSGVIPARAQAARMARSARCARSAGSARGRWLASASCRLCSTKSPCPWIRASSTAVGVRGRLARTATRRAAETFPRSLPDAPPTQAPAPSDPMFHDDDAPRPPAMTSQSRKAKTTKVATRLLVSASTGCGKTAPVHRLPREAGEAGVPEAPAFGEIEGMTAVGAAQGRNRHQPGADPVRGGWTRI